MISGPPFSQFLLALWRGFATAAIVLDYRDEWSTLRDAAEMMGPMAARRQCSSRCCFAPRM
jgi:hypothetical protein